MIDRRTFLIGATASSISASALFRSSRVSAQEGTVRVGSKDFPEAIILGEMYALLLEHAGLSVERKLNLGGTVVAHEALVNDELDVYPEYTGTGLLVVLKKTVPDAIDGTVGGAVSTPVSDPTVELVFNYVKSEYEKQFGLTWLPQTPMNNTQALAVTREFATEHNLTTITQLAELGKESDLSISAPSDFEEREDGLLGLQQVYGLSATVSGVAPGLKYQSFLDGDANVVLAFSTDAEIAINDLLVLQDDKGLWPPYHVAPVVRLDALSEHPGIADALNQLVPVLTTDAMIRLNGMVIGDDGMEPAVVASQFLQEQGLITG